MASPRSQLTGGTLVLDCAGLSLLCAEDKRVTAIVREAQNSDFRVVVSALTPIEACDMRVRNNRLAWCLSRLRIEPVSEEITWHAIELLRDAGLHGHKYAIDAVVAATALHSTNPVAIATSDMDDMQKLCGELVRIISV